MNKKLLCLLTLPAIVLSLWSCNSKPDVEPDIPDVPVQIPQVNFKNAVKALRTGFKVTGKLTGVTKYYVDKDHLNESSIPVRNTTYETTLTYTDTPDYVGTDFKFFELNEDGTKTFVGGDNFYNDEGTVAFNYIGYDNVLKNDMYATDENLNDYPYASSGLINPFNLIKSGDFKQDGTISSLTRTKATVLFNTLYAQLVEVPANINIESNSFTFNNDDLATMRLTTFPYNTVETIDYKNYYAQTVYEANLVASKVGTADSRDELLPEPEKIECVPLQEAINKLAETRNYRVRRHYKATDNGEPIEQEEAIDVYYDGAKKAVYQSVYQWQEGAPTGATEADALFADSKKDDDALLNAYMYQPNSEGNFAFSPTSLLSSVDNVLSYDQFTLTELGTVNANTFNKNEDGSYSPIPSNLATIASDVFVPFICTTSEIAGGYVDSFKLYLTDDNMNIDRIELVSNIGSVNALITIYYDQIGTAEIPFGALNNIVE